MDDAVADAGAELLAGLEHHVPPWIEDRIVALVVAWRGEADAAAVDAASRAGRAVADEARPALVRILVTEGPGGGEGGPLEALRRSVAPATATLADLGVPPVVRDEFAERRFPDDRYDLAPAAFADVHADLHDLGIVWGAATAHGHLRARAATERESGAGEPIVPAVPASEPPVPAVLAYAPDLMDRSRLTAAGAVRVVGRLDDLVAGRPAPRLVIVDLDRPGVIDVVGEIDAPVVGFYPHEDVQLRDRAVAAGCRDVLTRAQFFRRLPDLLAAL